MNAPRPLTETQLRVMKPLVMLFSRLHVWLFKRSGGRRFNRMGGGEVCVVRMTGAKSGAVREFPLMCIPHGDDILLVASFAGAPRHPVWYHNLVRHPRVEILTGGQSRAMTARLAGADEKAALWPVCCASYPDFARWPVCCASYPDFARYQQRTVRDIPVFVCEAART
ncbi:MAG: nitroreductase family deazaflavin-dependent oxidoreductase [Gammaproteobacteria bacterium]